MQPCFHARRHVFIICAHYTLAVYNLNITLLLRLAIVSLMLALLVTIHAGNRLVTYPSSYTVL